jgi:hypothetical protein
MERAFLGSILVGSTDPERLRSWYRVAFAPKQPEQGPLDVGEVLLVFEERTDIAQRNAEPGRAIINFHVEDAHAAVARLESVGVKWLTNLEHRPSGYSAGFLDPDGNCAQIIQFTA